MAPGGHLVRRAGGPGVHPQKGAVEQFCTVPPEGSIVVCLDEMGPLASKSDPGQRIVKPAAPGAERTRQDIDHGRRGKSHVFGAFCPATGAALTAFHDGRTTANWVDVLSQAEGWIDPGVPRVYAVVDNLSTHSATDVLLFALAHPRWEFVLQPKYATSPNLIEPGWKVLRSPVLKGRRFET